MECRFKTRSLEKDQIRKKEVEKSAFQQEKSGDIFIFSKKFLVQDIDPLLLRNNVACDANYVSYLAHLSCSIMREWCKKFGVVVRIYQPASYWYYWYSFTIHSRH